MIENCPSTINLPATLLARWRNTEIVSKEKLQSCLESWWVYLCTLNSYTSLPQMFLVRVGYCIMYN